MNIKGSILNKVSYNGEIKVTINNKGHKSELKLHNEGTKLLFDTVTKALCGYSIKNEVPKYINIRYTSEAIPTPSDNDFMFALTSPVILTGKIFGKPAGASDTNGRVLFECELDNSVKRSGLSGYNWQLCLLNSNLGVLAIIDNNDDVKTIYDNISTNKEVIIEWALQFSDANNIISDTSNNT